MGEKSREPARSEHLADGDAEGNGRENGGGKADSPDTSNSSGRLAAKLVVAKNVYPEHLPIIPLPTRPVFPKTVAPLVVDTEYLAKLAKTAIESPERLVGLVLARQPEGAESGAAAVAGGGGTNQRRDEQAQAARALLTRVQPDPQLLGLAHRVALGSAH